MSSDDAAIYRGRKLSDRVDDRRRQLLDAGFRILGDEGGSALTMRAVTREARLSPRYFYESFADRNELVLAVFDDTVGRLAECVTTAMAPAPAPIDRVAAAFDAASRLFEREPRIARILLRGAFSDDTLRDHAYSALPAFVLSVALALGEGAAAASPRLQLDVSALSGSVVTLFLDWTEGRLPVGREELVDYCTDMVASMFSRQVGTAPG